MKAYRVVFGMAVALAVVGLAVTAGVAEEREKKSDKKDEVKVGGKTYQGVLERADVKARTLSLIDAKAQDDKEGKGKAMTVAASSTATVTLDGKKATLADLKKGHFIRFRSGLHSADKGGDSSEGREKRPLGKDSDVRDRPPVAERIEAFTKQPSDEKK